MITDEALLYNDSVGSSPPFSRLLVPLYLLFFWQSPFFKQSFCTLLDRKIEGILYV